MVSDRKVLPKSGNETFIDLKYDEVIALGSAKLMMDR